MNLLSKNEPKSCSLTSKILKIMKLATILFLVLTLQVTAAVSSQTVTFSGKNVAIKKVLSVIKDQTDYVFFYDVALLKDFKTISLNLVNTPIENVLEQVFVNQPIKWMIEGKTISFVSKAKKAKEVTISLAVQKQIKGKVIDEKGLSIPGANIVVKGTRNSTQTDADGSFSINVSENDTKLIVSFIGMATQEVAIGNVPRTIILSETGQKLEEVVIGSRNPTRTVTESAVPIDVISMREIVTKGSQTNLNQILNMVAPSFTSNTQTAADGTDHIDPAQLRGLGPDQVLVLVNGKRRHTSSLVNNNGTVGRGSVGTDLNAIPAFALEKIEVLRDGASAQYGSDAIAGVINLGLKKNTNKQFDVMLYGGSNFSKGSNNNTGGNDGSRYQLDMNYGAGLGKEKSFINLTGSFQVREAYSRASNRTGNIYNAYNAIDQRATEAGTNINSLFGNITNTPNTSQILSEIKTYAPQINYFSPSQQTAISNAASISEMQAALNFDATAGELAYRGLERKDFNMRIGQSALKSMQFFVNAAYPINDNIEVYAFGGTSFRDGLSSGNYRLPNAFSSYPKLYPNGFLPEISSTVNDVSIATGIKGKVFENWNFDLSNTYGKNTFDFHIQNTVNASMRENSPKEFEAGGFGFYQNTANFDINRKYDVLKGLNLAFGTEYRIENYNIDGGQPDSYSLYDINGNTVTGTVPNNIRVTDFFGNLRPGGSQVFSGFRPANVVSKGRNSMALYTDVELDITEKLLLNGAVRFENYSDFGNTTNFKLASRYKLTNNINLRGALSNGFRAPSLHQIYFSTTATLFSNGVPSEIGTFSNDSQMAKLVGIPQLKQEVSKSGSIGFTAKIPSANLTLTADAYVVNVKDRVVLTSSFSRPAGTPASGSPQYVLQGLFDGAGATSATFFANAIDTKSKGIDVVISQKANLGDGISLKNDLSATFSGTKRVGNIHASQILQDNGQLNNYFSESSRVYLEEAIPRIKANLTNSLVLNKFDFFLMNVYFGEVTSPNTVDANRDGRVEGTIINGQAVEVEHPVWGAKITTDFAVGYKITEAMKLVVGSNNIFDIYPDKNLGPISAVRPRLVNGALDYTAAPSTIDLSSGNQYTYPDRVSQFGFSGRFVYARISYKF
ncbi:iron complex outermembrane recepter protein [Flavobacterium segetis]|uniref:Iron complex outermembrane recepter protein n=2 Tax=Flavobacterium segetis TaxID=271157 RepID=A0A1M5IRJ5_9FLAO|nr:iron complex outermembrane recepter protein [Flavobacterium segetis]